MNIEPIKPHDAGGRDWRDQAKDGFDLRSLERLVRDCNDQPDRWRRRSDLCHAYYDGKQLDEQQQAWAIAEGLKPRATNLIQRTVNAVLGFEARTRSDVRIEADDDELSDVVDFLNTAFKEAQREAYTEIAIGQAYAGQVKGGIGWIEVSRDQDPLAYPYRVREVHRNSMYWDWHARDQLLRDARWVARMEWKDLDELEAAMPEHRHILRMLANSWEGWAANQLIEEHANHASDMLRAFDDFRRFKVSSAEWLDTLRKRVRMYEVWYRVPARAVVMRISPTRTIIFDEKNPLHVTALQRGLVKLEKVLTTQVRKAIFAGPYRLMDVGTTRRSFPYIPFFAFRDDEDRAPYGLVDGMIDPQAE